MKINQLKLKKIKIDKEFIKDALNSSLFSLIITLISVLILGIIIKFVEIPNNILMPINQVIKVVSLLLGCIFGIRTKEQGAFKGGITGVIYTLLSIFIFLILGTSLKESFNYIDIIFGTVIGIITGIIAVNTGKKRF